jgi:protein SCO1/2
MTWSRRIVLVGMLSACHHARAAAPTPPTSVTAPAAAAAPGALPVYGTLPELALVDENGRAFTRDRLGGHVWIANFIFTTCHMACPMLSARMGFIQTRVQKENPALQLLSVSILPDEDTPPVLKKYAAKFHQDPARWTFVTGKTHPVFTAVSEAYKQAIDPNKDFIALHGEMFVLIDGAGRVRGFYSKSDTGVDKLIADALALSHDAAYAVQ